MPKYKNRATVAEAHQAQVTSSRLTPFKQETSVRSTSAPLRHSSPLNEFRWPVTLSLALVICAFTAVAAAQEPQAALPNAYIDTTWNPPVGGTTWAAHTAAQFSSAL